MTESTRSHNIRLGEYNISNISQIMWFHKMIKTKLTYLSKNYLLLYLYNLFKE